jgi:pimeloyl-ACP methyl ester carboxylesterase
MVQLINIASGNGEPRSNAIFVHGLGGDLYGTWQGGDDPRSFWPRWLAEDIKSLAVYLVGYEASVSRWRGSAMHLTDRATSILARLLAEPALRKGSLILIGHSLGGLVIKQMLRTAESEARHRADVADLMARVEKVAFLATPHTGAGLPVLGDRLRILVRPSAATVCLVRNDPNLSDLNLWYRDWANARSILHLVLTETNPLRVLGMIVKPDSADPGLVGGRPIPIDGDHWSMCKPDHRKSATYVQMVAFIERTIERPTAPGEGKLDALSEGQKELMRQTETMLTMLGREKPIPRETFYGVPPRIAGFTGRTDELDRLNAVLMQDRPAAVTQAIGRAAVQGLGGVGKTSLAVEYAHRYRSRYAGVCWCPAETRVGLLSVLASLAVTLGAATAEEADVENAAKAALRQLAEQRATWLLVYDKRVEPGRNC